MNVRFDAVAIATVLAVGLAPLPARAVEPDAASPSADDGQPADRAAALRKSAEQKYFEDDFTGALADFEAAWELSPHPTDLFNMGRIHEEKGELVLAVQRYEQFVEQPRIPLEERALVAERLEVLRVLVAEQTPSTPSPPPPRPTDTSDRRATPMVDDPRAKTVRPLVISGSTLAGVGAAVALAGGLGFGLAARRDSRRIERLGEGSNPERLGLSEAEDLDARGRDLETLQIASVAAGAALVVLGTALLTTGLVRRRAAARNTTLAHVVGLRTPWRF